MSTRKKVADVGDFEVIAGEPWEQSFRLNNLTSPTTKVPEDLTGWTGWFCNWRPYVTSTETISLTVEVEPLDGLLTIIADEAETALMLVRGTVGVFGIAGIDPDGNERTRIRGTTSQSADPS